MESSSFFEEKLKSILVQNENPYHLKMIRAYLKVICIKHSAILANELISKYNLNNLYQVPFFSEELFDNLFKNRKS